MSPDVAQELDRIAARIGDLVKLTLDLRQENQTLKNELERSAADNQALKDRLDAARTRVEGLIDRLPADL